LLALPILLIAASTANVDIRPLLVDEGFEAPINGREQIKYAGHIRQGRNDYRIYVYRGVHRAAVVDHGVNRIIVIRNGVTFLGEYFITMPTQCVVRRQTVFCGTENGYPNMIRFTKNGPPAEVWFGGEVVRFALGNKVKLSN
jgi:hypothetical protein